MTVNEMHIAFELEVDKLNAALLDEMSPEEIDYWLNKGMDLLIEQSYNANSRYRPGGAESSQNRIDELRHLTVELSGTTFFRDTNIEALPLPNDYLHLLRLQGEYRYHKCLPVTKSLKDARSGTWYYFMIPFSPGSIETFEGFDIRSPHKNGDSIFDEEVPGYESPTQTTQLINWVLENTPSGLEMYWESYLDIYKKDHFILVGQSTVPVEVVYDAVTSSGTVSATRLRTKRVTFSEEPTLRKDGVRFVQHDDLDHVLRDPFNKPTIGEALYTFRSNFIDIYTNDTFTLPECKITYIRKPKRISLNLNQDCELPDEMHRHVIQLAVAGALETLDSSRYQTYDNEVRKEE